MYQLLTHLTLSKVEHMPLSHVNSCPIPISMPAYIRLEVRTRMRCPSSSMATLTQDYFVKNKDKWSSWETTWLLGATTAKPLPKTCYEALYNYLETGELQYLPDDSDTILNVLTDGIRTDDDRVMLHIPDKCKWNLLYFDSLFLIILRGRETTWRSSSYLCWSVPCIRKSQ